MPFNEKFFSYRTIWAVVLGLAVGGFHMELRAQGSAGDRVGSISIVAINDEVKLDGISSESFWQSIPALPLTVREPVHQAQPTERSEIRIAHDAAFLYVSGRLYDSDPQGIRTNSMYRDQQRGDDIFGILINPYDDNDIGLVFWTTPAGVRGDAEVPGDATGGFNADWNTHWDVATHQNEDGWFVEMRIPFSSLGFQASQGQVPIAFTTYRYIARKNERQIFPDIAPEYNYLRASLAHSTVIHGIESRRPARTSPSNTTRGPAPRLSRAVRLEAPRRLRSRYARATESWSPLPSLSHR